MTHVSSTLKEVYEEECAHFRKYKSCMALGLCPPKPTTIFVVDDIDARTGKLVAEEPGILTAVKAAKEYLDFLVVKEDYIDGITFLYLCNCTRKEFKERMKADGKT